MIRLNNEKRKQLNEINKTYYDDMLIYIRTNAMKSEQQTEEVLLELLDHLLEAQAEGKTAIDVFGEDLKAYCDEVIEEIPGEKSSKSLSFIGFLLVDLAAIAMLTFGILGFGIHFIFGLGKQYFNITLGKEIAVFLIDALLIGIWIFIILRWIKHSTFKEKKTNKWIAFLQLWVISTIFIGLSIVTFIVFPDFGTSIKIHQLMIAAIGLILYVIKIYLNKKVQFT